MCSPGHLMPCTHTLHVQTTAPGHQIKCSPCLYFLSQTKNVITTFAIGKSFIWNLHFGCFNWKNELLGVTFIVWHSLALHKRNRETFYYLEWNTLSPKKSQIKCDLWLLWTQEWHQGGTNLFLCDKCLYLGLTEAQITCTSLLWTTWGPLGSHLRWLSCFSHCTDHHTHNISVMLRCIQKFISCKLCTPRNSHITSSASAYSI